MIGNKAHSDYAVNLLQPVIDRWVVNGYLTNFLQCTVPLNICSWLRLLGLKATKQLWMVVAHFILLFVWGKIKFSFLLIRYFFILSVLSRQFCIIGHGYLQLFHQANCTESNGVLIRIFNMLLAHFILLK